VDDFDWTERVGTKRRYDGVLRGLRTFLFFFLARIDDFYENSPKHIGCWFFISCPSIVLLSNPNAMFSCVQVILRLAGCTRDVKRNLVDDGR
jgi:hypothetical protein